MTRSSPGAPYVTVPSLFVLPHKPAKGAAAAVRGYSRSSPGARYLTVPSLFVLPGKPAKGQHAVRRGTFRSSPGSPWVSITVPSKFYLPHKPATGKPAAVRGRSRSLTGHHAPIALFIAPAKPAVGKTRVRTAGRATGSYGAPFVYQQRTLLLVLASQGGIDDYGNAYSEGVTVGPNTSPQVALVPGGTGYASELQFPVNTIATSQTPGISAGAAGGDTFAALEMIGPASNVPGSEDFVYFEMSSNAGGGSAALEFAYVPSGSSGQLTASYNSSEWNFTWPVSFSGAVSITDGITVDYMTSPNGNPVFGWSETGLYPASTGGSTFGGGAGCSLSTGDFNAAAITDLETLQSIANGAVELANYLYEVLQDAGIIAGG